MRREIKWKTIAALAALYLAIFFNWTWVLGVLFLLWTLPALATGSTYLVEEIERRHHPVLFWLIAATWIVLSLWVIAAGFVPALQTGWTGAGPATYAAESTGSYVPASLDRARRETPANAPVEGAPADRAAESADESAVENAAENAAEPRELQFATYDAPPLRVVGLSTTSSYADDRYVRDLERLWLEFAQSELAAAPVGGDERVYVVYSESDRGGDSFRVTLGYVAESSSAVDGLASVQVPATTFAVFQPTWRGDDTVAELWSKIWQSDLPTDGAYGVEVYTLDPQTYDVASAELWVSLR